MKRSAFLALAVYIVSIPLANYFIQHVGTQHFPTGPHVIPVGFGFDAPSGTLCIGLALVARDVVQRFLGRHVAVLAILAGAALSYFVAPAFAWASACAFLIGELVDFLVYTPLENRRLYLAVLASGAAGAIVDSLIFLQLAFGATTYWQGNTIGKVLMSVAALPVLWIVRRRAVA